MTTRGSLEEYPCC